MCFSLCYSPSCEAAGGAQAAGFPRQPPWSEAAGGVHEGPIGHEWVERGWASPSLHQCVQNISIRRFKARGEF